VTSHDFMHVRSAVRGARRGGARQARVGNADRAEPDASATDRVGPKLARRGGV
jgi:hypothetical protein